VVYTQRNRYCGNRRLDASRVVCAY
jgi:hypothetical protein